MLAPQRAQRKECLVQEPQVRRAVIALLKHIEKERAGKAALFTDADVFSLIVSLKRMSGDKKTKPKRLPIPHPFYQAEGKEVCLFVKDHDGEGHKTAKEKIKQTENSGVAKVIGVSKLRSNYKAPESRRRLCNSFDLFCADDRILPVLPKLIGKTFFKKKKQPVPVDLTSKDWAAEIRKATSATYVFLTGGTSLNIKVGISDQAEEEITANIMAAAAGAAGFIPRGWDNIQALYLKTTASVALPIFTASLALPAKIPAELGAKGGAGGGEDDGGDDSGDDERPAAKAAKRAKADTPGKAGGGAPKAASARNRPMLMQEQAEAAAGAGASAKGAAAGGKRPGASAAASGAGGAGKEKAAKAGGASPPAAAAAAAGGKAKKQPAAAAAPKGGGKAGGKTAEAAAGAGGSAGGGKKPAAGGAAAAAAAGKKRKAGM